MTPEDRIDAAELVLGLLDGTERAAALRRVLAEPGFAAEVAWWRDRLDPFVAGYEAVDPPTGLLDKVERLIDAPPGAAEGRPARSWPWLAGGAVGGAIAASVLAMLVLPSTLKPPAPAPRVEAPAPAPLLVAVLVPAKGEQRQAIAALVEPGEAAARLTAAIEVASNRSAELWVIGADGKPRALGLLSGSESLRSAVKLNLVPAAGETLAVSVEPVGGSPTGAPTGPVVASGQLVSG